MKERVEEVVESAVETVMHRHPRELVQSPSFGVRMAAVVAHGAGSWAFIIGYLVFTAVYTLGHQAGVFHFDPYPYQFYTFLVSVLAILLAQTILLFQNQQADIETKIAHNAYAQLDNTHKMLTQVKAINERQSLMLEELRRLSGRVHEVEEKTHTDRKD